MPGCPKGRPSPPGPAPAGPGIPNREESAVSSLSPTQLEERARAITATDIAAICGLHPYRAPIDVWLEKTGQAPPWVDTERTKWGVLLEPVIRADYAERKGLTVEEPGTLTHPKMPWMKATPDGIAYEPRQRDPSNGLEIKTHTVNIRHLYGDPFTDEVPLYVLAQSTWNIGVTGLDRWDVVAFIDGQPLDYTVTRDDELLGQMLERGKRFLVDHVRARKEPEADGTDAFTAWLQRRYPVAASDPKSKAPLDLVDIGGDEAALADVLDLQRYREEKRALIKEETTVVQRLKGVIGDHQGLQWRDAGGKLQKITWKRPQDSHPVDVAAAFDHATQIAAQAHQLAGPHLRTLRAVLGTWAPAARIVSNDPKVAGDAFAGAVVNALELAEQALQALSLRDKLLAPHTTTVENSRRFVVPKSWNGNTAPAATGGSTDGE
jgi:putative phage-type endonuclease